MQAETALVVVDVQCGFTSLCPNELPVSGGLEIVANVNRLLAIEWQRIDATQDWHPSDHCSFLGQRDNIYPPHCVAGTPGADFLPGLATNRFHAIWRKGFRRDLEAYGVTAQHPAFVDTLRASGIRHVVACGIATNICVFQTARDLAKAGFQVTIAEDASAGIDIPAFQIDQGKTKLEGLNLGIQYRTVDEILRC